MRREKFSHNFNRKKEPRLVDWTRHTCRDLFFRMFVVERNDRMYVAVGSWLLYYITELKEREANKRFFLFVSTEQCSAVTQIRKESTEICNEFYTLNETIYCFKLNLFENFLGGFW